MFGKKLNDVNVINSMLAAEDSVEQMHEIWNVRLLMHHLYLRPQENPRFLQELKLLFWQ